MNGVFLPVNCIFKIGYFFCRDLLIFAALKQLKMNFPSTQRELGDIVYVEVETVGKSMNAGEVFGTVEAVKTVSDLYLPVSGTILELNAALAGAPELVNNEPYEGGWMVKIKLDRPDDVKKLMDAAAYEATVG
jgi:glycine cleavage system H protein